MLKGIKKILVSLVAVGLFGTASLASSIPALAPKTVSAATTRMSGGNVSVNSFDQHRIYNSKNNS